jgi:LacI family transcriptional regulator
VGLSHSQDRILGYQAALRDYGLPGDERLIAKGGFRLENGRKAAFCLLDMEPPPTAIFAYNDIMAIGALRAVHERGLRVPEDFSVVGFDDIPQAAFTCPALTTVSQPKLDMGCRGAELLLDLIARKTPPDEVAAPLEVQLVVRESTARPLAHVAEPPVPAPQVQAGRAGRTVQGTGVATGIHKLDDP